MVDSLEKYEDFKFNWADTNFLSRWYDLQTNETQAKVKRFVGEGRLGIMGGTWVMNDETLPEY